MKIGAALSFICLAVFFLMGMRSPRVSASKSLDTFLEQQTVQKNFSGTVLIAHKDNILLKKAYGYANYELSVPNTNAIRFRIGSITKQFTAVAIMQLQEKGLLNVNEPLAKYIPNFPNGSNITLHHLLTHTSGIFNISTLPDIIERAKQSVTLVQEVDFIRGQKAEFNPGDRYSYNNSGYILLTYIIEKVSGKSYGNYLQENIFNPLGMLDSGIDSPIPIIKNRASGYSKDQTGLINAPYTDMAWTAGAGQIYSTIEDMYRWHRALQKGTILTRESILLMQKAHTCDKDRQNECYGYGFYHVPDTKFGVLLGHRGGTLGFKSAYYYYPKHDLTIIILSNFMFAPLKEIILEGIANIAVS